MVVDQCLFFIGPPFSNITLYHFFVGVLQYLTITRPNLTHSINYVSQFLHTPTKIHFYAVKIKGE